MSFTPGKLIYTFTTKNGHQAELKYPSWDVLPQLLDYINALSAEDTFVRFSGEEISFRDEAKYLSSVFVNMEMKEAVFLYCFIEGKLVGLCQVSKIPGLKERGKHVALFGLSVAKEHRGDGIGYELSKATIEHAKEQLEGLRLITLTCFATNTPALALYEKLGFKEVGRMPEYLLHKGEYIDEVQMALKLVS
jgi:RimJ/RimL family protein N-acetyltransferase